MVISKRYLAKLLHGISPFSLPSWSLDVPPSAFHMLTDWPFLPSQFCETSTTAWCLYSAPVRSCPSGQVKVNGYGFSVIATLFERLEGHVGG